MSLSIAGCPRSLSCILTTVITVFSGIGAEPFRRRKRFKSLSSSDVGSGATFWRSFKESTSAAVMVRFAVERFEGEPLKPRVFFREELADFFGARPFFFLRFVVAVRVNDFLTITYISQMPPLIVYRLGAIEAPGVCDDITKLLLCAQEGHFQFL